MKRRDFLKGLLGGAVTAASGNLLAEFKEVTVFEADTKSAIPVNPNAPTDTYSMDYSCVFNGQYPTVSSLADAPKHVGYFVHCVEDSEMYIWEGNSWAKL